jgi:hypothetical protein
MSRRTLASLPFAVVTAVAALTAAGCASEPAPPAPLRSVRVEGFLIQDDGSLTDAERLALTAELTSSREKILKFLGGAAAPGDFRSFEERRAASCPLPPPGDTRILVLGGGGGRCHADESGVTLLRAHIERKDGTHELVHYLAGGSWRPIDEGLAVYLTEKLCGPAWGVSVDIRSRVYLDLSMEGGLDRDHVRLGMNRRDYDTAGSFVKFLIEERGLEKFLDLYRGPQGDFHDVYGISEQELVATWRQKIREFNVRQNASYYRFKDHLTSLRSGQ